MQEILPKIDNLFDFLSVHKEMLTDTIRIEAYTKAIKNLVRPGKTVVDVGTGTGILAILCAKAGARRVYAIEYRPIIDLAKQIARKNGCADRITFLRGDSRHVKLPEKVDVVVSEVIGHCILDENMLDSVIDAGCRFLKKGGQVIPQMVEMFFAPVYDAKAYDQLMFWRGKICNIDYAPTWMKAVNTVYACPWDQQTFPAEPKALASIDLASVNKVDLSSKSSFLVTQDGMMNGFAGWFKATLDSRNEIAINTGPSTTNTHWGYAFFPIEEPLLVKKGQTINFELTCYSDSDSTTWEWIVSVMSGDKLVSRNQQSTALY